MNTDLTLRTKEYVSFNLKLVYRDGNTGLLEYVYIILERTRGVV